MLRAPALGVTTLALVALSALPAFAAGLAVTVNQVDTSAFPKVRVAVSVADSVGLPITGLDAQAFELKEDDQVISPLRVDSVVESQESVATALVMDVSGSMADNGKIDSARNAATAFIDTLGPKDSAAIISFSDAVKVVQPYTSDRAALKTAIAGLKPEGDTAIYDAVSQTAQLQGALPQRRKILLLLTDGEDRVSKQSLDAAIAAAQQAGVVVFAIGLGEDDVSHEVLDRLAGSTGQAVYVSDPAQLRETFLSIGDRLRRQYVLEYTSNARGDDKPHALALKASYRGQVADTKGSFTAPKIPLVLDVRGITNAGRVDGVQRIDVAVSSGEARQVELLVDEQSRGIVSTPPFTFQWDTQAEKPGIHKVVVRATDASGVVTDRDLAVEVQPSVQATVAVIGPAPAAVPTPAPASTSRGSRNFWEDNIGIAIAISAGMLLVLGAGGLYLVTRNRRRKRVEKVRAVPEPPSDKTEFIAHGAPLSDMTMISHRKPVALLPKAKLVLGPGQEVAVLPTGQTTIGRDSTSSVVLDDPQASRHHAQIVFKDDAYWLEDLGSTNGTRVNGQAVTRHKLQSNEQIAVGDAVLTFALDTP